MQGRRLAVAPYSLTIHLAFKFYPHNTVCLYYNKVHLINCIEKGMKPIKHLSRCYFSDSNIFAFIEDLENQINNAIFNYTERVLLSRIISNLLYQR